MLLKLNLNELCNLTPFGCIADAKICIIFQTTKHFDNFFQKIFHFLSNLLKINIIIFTTYLPLCYPIPTPPYVLPVSLLPMLYPPFTLNIRPQSSKNVLTHIFDFFIGGYPPFLKSAFSKKFSQKILEFFLGINNTFYFFIKFIYICINMIREIHFIWCIV